MFLNHSIFKSFLENEVEKSKSYVKSFNSSIQASA